MAEKETEVKIVKGKARYWCAVLYPENMRPDWEQVIGDVLGVPYAYCYHDKDMLATYKAKQEIEGHDSRKMHVHCIIAYGNTTTYNAVYNLFLKLSAPRRKCLAWVEPVLNVRSMYEYLIHNTETAKKQGKYQYKPSERITGNNFDIGSFEQFSKADKLAMSKEICQLIVNEHITNFADLFLTIVNNYDNEYFEMLQTNSGFYARLLDGMYQRSLRD